MVALDAVVGGFVHLVVDLTRADLLGHGEKARGYFYYFIFYLGIGWVICYELVFNLIVVRRIL